MLPYPEPPIRKPRPWLPAAIISAGIVIAGVAVGGAVIASNDKSSPTGGNSNAPGLRSPHAGK